VVAIEQGRYSPTLELAFRIARVFGVPIESVFGFGEVPGRSPGQSAV
jgi:putative transcriptional regulator